MTCHLDHGQPYHKNDDLNWSIISYDYIETMKNREKNDDGHKIGFDELELNKRKNKMRKFVLGEQRFKEIAKIEQIDETERRLTQKKLRQHPNELRAGFRDGLTDFIGFRDPFRTCAICSKFMELGTPIVRLSCNKTCFFHEDCYKNLLHFYKQKEEDPICPICQAEIEQEEVEFEEMSPIKPSKEEIQPPPSEQ